MNDVPIAVLVITTMPDRPTTARVVATQNARSGIDTTVVISSLAELVHEVEGWWFDYWRPEDDAIAFGQP